MEFEASGAGAGPSGSGSGGSGGSKRPLNDSQDRTPLSKRPNVETSGTDLIRIEVSKVKIQRFSGRKPMKQVVATLGFTIKSPLPFLTVKILNNPLNW
jgi:hypothetical protein